MLDKLVFFTTSRRFKQREILFYRNVHKSSTIIIIYDGAIMIVTTTAINSQPTKQLCPTIIVITKDDIFY